MKDKQSGIGNREFGIDNLEFVIENWELKINVWCFRIESWESSTERKKIERRELIEERIDNWMISKENW